MPLSLRWFLPCLAAAVLAAAALVAQTPRKVSDSEVASVQRSAILIDTHNDVTSDTVDGLEFGKRRATGHTDLERLLEGGVGATFFAAFAGAVFTAFLAAAFFAGADCAFAAAFCRRHRFFVAAIMFFIPSALI